MSATKIAAAGSAILLVPVLIIIAAIAAVSTIFSSTAGSPSQTALADIPAGYLDLYIHAAALCPGLDWTILAAIGKIETDHGRSTLPGVSSGENSHGAGGVMQVLQPTWNTILAHHELPAGGATPPSRYNPHDAIFAAAFYLCDNGARDRRDLRGAIFAYNHDDSYVEHVLAQAARYARPVEACTAARPGPAPTTRPTATQPSPTALQHIARVHRRGVRLRPTRETLRLGRQRQTRIRLLRAHSCRLRRRRHADSPHRANPVQRRPPPARRDSTATRRPALLRHN